jgi:hypothetical protein
MVPFLNPQPALSLVSGNRSSCPTADPYASFDEIGKLPFERSLWLSVRSAGQLSQLFLQQIEIDRLGEKVGRTQFARLAATLVIASAVTIMTRQVRKPLHDLTEQL